jgi:hypothetical protein
MRGNPLRKAKRALVPGTSEKVTFCQAGAVLHFPGGYGIERASS